MSVFQRGKWYHYEFVFHGVRVRVPAKTTSLEVAERLEREHRRRLELGQMELQPKKQKLLTFASAVEEYMRLQPHWKPKTLTMHKTSLPKVSAFFGGMVLTEIKAKHIQEYQVLRKSQLTIYGKQPSNRTINT